MHPSVFRSQFLGIFRLESIKNNIGLLLTCHWHLVEQNIISLFIKMHNDKSTTAHHIAIWVPGWEALILIIILNIHQLV